MSHNTLSDSLVIKRASVADAQTVISLSVTTFFDSFGPVNDPAHMKQYHEEEMNDAKLTAELADDKNYFFLAYVGDTAIGYAKLRNLYTPSELEGIQSMEMERLYVMKEYQNLKTGAALMQYCVAHARQQGYTTLWLGVWEHNTRAIKFYEKCGFSVFSSHIFRLGTDEQTDLLMKKALEP